MKARVYLEWTPSASLDVVEVGVNVKVDEETVFDTVLTPDVNKVDIGVYDEGTVLVGTVSVSDGTYVVPSVTSFQVPDLTKPEAVTDLGWTYEIVE